MPSEISSETTLATAAPVAAREPLVRVRDLRVWFDLRRGAFGHAGSVHAVDGVNFDLDAGEAIAIVGESGCGKSTLMKTILGLNQATAGQVNFGGKAVGDMSRQELKAYRSRIGYVQQDPFGALAPFMTVERLLSEPLVINGVPTHEHQERIHRVMEEVKLAPVEDFVGKFPHQLSGGQLQRVVIARAMILQPRMIVADEPVSMLDASVRVEILKLLRTLQEEHHLSVMYITHDLSTVRYFSERIFVMYAGWLVERAPVDELLYSPLHPYTDALLAATSDPDARNALTYKQVPPGEPPSLVKPPQGCRFHPRCPKRIEGLCDVEAPPDLTPQPNHNVLCWLYK
ncbi:MAG: ABC transporter ATP-binding protein [Anaerolineae bacterium]|jgi:peptide/nickel transport system ATP-binding protein|nr:ABC transporter ATP-binding protein [Chloroflexota bacterium]